MDADEVCTLPFPLLIAAFTIGGVRHTLVGAIVFDIEFLSVTF